MYTQLQKVVWGIVGLVVLVPTVSFAQTVPNTTTDTSTNTGVYSSCSQGIDDLTDLILWPVCIINNAVIPLLVTLALAVFMWGIIQYIAKPGDAGFRKNITAYMGWAILALFVMLSVWGLVYLIGSTLQIGQGGVGPVPTLYQGQ